MNKKNVVVIGGGFAGLSSACFLAKAGHNVTVLEKNEDIGGRARKFMASGFTFDMGPSWYWMPDVFERFYNQFGKTTADFYELVRLDPSYKVYWPTQNTSNQNNYWDIPAHMDEVCNLMESVEEGSAKKFRAFMAEAAYKYKAGIGKFVHLPGKSWLEYLDPEVITASFRLHLFNDMASYIRKYFKDPRIISLLEFPVLFLGEMPRNTPALYSLMNYADMELGTWFPLGGMSKIVDAFMEIATSMKVTIKTSTEVTGIGIENNKVVSVSGTFGTISCDALVASADYHHVDQILLPKAYRQYSPGYWEKRKMAPSSLLYYIGINKKLKYLLHHNLFFDTDFQQHAKEIYAEPKWPTAPLFYVSVTSKTDPSTAPEGGENIFILIPTAPGLIDTDHIQEKYFDIIIARLEHVAGESIREHIVYKRNFATRDFIQDYHAHKGNAYGLANTLLQTGPLKPALCHRKVKNMFFAGQLTVPGPGVPPSIISGELAAKEVCKILR